MAEDALSRVTAALAGVWQPEVVQLLLFALVAAAVVAWRRPEDRQTVANTLGLHVACLVGQLVAALLAAHDMAGAATVLGEFSIVTGGIAAIRLSGLLLFRVVLRVVGLHPPRIVEDICVMLAYVAWGLVRLRHAGLDLSGIVTTSAVITAVVAFAMQDTLGNILGGVALELDSSLSIGDWVKVDDVSGKVVDIRWRSTSIETRNGETVVVPNSQMVRGRFTIVGKRKGRPVQCRRWVWVSVDLAAPPARVIGSIRTALAEAAIERVASDPAPDCVLMDFDRGFARYAVRYWLADIEHDDPTDSLVRAHVLTALQREGLRIAVPETSVRLTQQDERHRQEVRERELQRRLEVLRTVRLFGGLNEDEMRRVAERLTHAPFARGATITRQGAIAHWLYILASGEADVVVREADGTDRLMVTLQAGTFFGEMGLLTGEPRRATVTARTDVECYRLDKVSLEDVIQDRPEIADGLSAVLSLRRADLDRKLVQGEGAAQEETHARALEILGRIRQFFGIQNGEKRQP